MRIHRIIIIGLFLTLVVLLQADYEGENGFQMLQISPNASQSGMAGTGMLFADNGSVFWDNAAAGLMNENRSISVNQSFWIFDTSLTTLAYTYPKGNHHIGLGFKYLDYGNFERRDYVGTYFNDYYPIDFQLTLNWAFRLNPNHYIGVNGSFIYEKLDTSTCAGASFDLGYIYKTPIRGTNAYVSLKHLGGTNKMESESIDLPLTVEGGITHVVEMESFVINTDLKATQEKDNNFKAAFGVEGGYRGLLFLRTGYRFNYDTEEFSFGAGIKLEKIDINYAYIPAVEEIDSVNMIGVSYKF